MKIGLVQYDPIWENKEKNKEKILSLLNSLNDKLDFLIFPEMTLTGYTMNTILGEPFEISVSPTIQFFSQISRDFSVNVFAGFIELEMDKAFNSLIIFDRNGKILDNYRKIHLFSFAGEDKYYTSGDRPVIVEIDNFKIGLSICYDLRFPELFRIYAKQKIHLIVNIANWPDSRIEHYIHLLKSRAIENQCFVAGVNRVGRTKKDNYDGRSSIFDPSGNEIINVKDVEKIVLAEIDLSLIDMIRSKFPFLNDIKLI